MGFHNGFPKSVQICCAEGAVIEAVAGHGDLSPDHAAVVGTDGAGKADVIKGEHDFIHIEGAVGGKMGGLFEIGRGIKFQVAHMGEMNPALQGADHVRQVVFQVGAVGAGTEGDAVVRVIHHFHHAKDVGLMELDNDTMEFGYRKSVLKDRPYAVLEVTMKLQEGNREEILARMNELADRRRQKQPLEYASAGSTFKRPEGNFAGKLIMDAGLRGLRIGGARVSDKHCGFIINDGTATAADIAELIEEVSERVKEKFGVSLEPEVIFLGDF